jgi:hypothetical protein
LNANANGRYWPKASLCGDAISPHLFRTIAATTAADAKGDMPRLASALLVHIDPRVTEEHCNRASSLNAADQYAELLQKKYDRRL